MIEIFHLKNAIKRMWLKALLLGVALFSFEMIFALVGTSTDIRQNFLEDMTKIPPLVEKMLGKGFMEAILKYGVMALGYLHPFMMILFIIFIFFTISHMVTSELSSGTIGFTLSKPISRKNIFLNMAIILYSGLGFLALSTYMSSFLGVQLFMKQSQANPFGALAWNIYLVMILIAGYLVILASFSESNKMHFTVGAITLLSLYLLNFAAPLWRPLEFLNPINPFFYYRPMQILIGARIGFGTSITIIGFSILMFTIGAWIFNRRDIASG